MAESKSANWVVVGRLVAAHGVRGELKVQSHTEEMERLLDFPQWSLGEEAGSLRQLSLISGRATAKGLIVRLAGIDDRDAAQSLAGLDIWVPRSELPKLEEGQYYWADLEGMTVITEDGEELGEVSHLFATGANDVMSVQLQGAERLLPFIPDVVLRVDTDAKRIVVRLMPGM